MPSSCSWPVLKRVTQPPDPSPLQGIEPISCKNPTLSLGHQGCTRRPAGKAGPQGLAQPSNIQGNISSSNTRKVIHFSEDSFHKSCCTVTTPLSACWSRQDQFQCCSAGFKGPLKYGTPIFFPPFYNFSSSCYPSPSYAYVGDILKSSFLVLLNGSGFTIAI